MNELNIYAAREIADQLGVSPHTVQRWAAMGAPIDPENHDVSGLKQWISNTGALRPWPAEFMEHVIEETIGDRGKEAVQDHENGALLENSRLFALVVIEAFRSNPEALNELLLLTRAAENPDTPDALGGASVSHEVKEYQMASQSERSPDAHDGTTVTRIRPAAYLRAILAAAWSCFRHPLSSTVIDLTTGKASQLQGRP